MQMASNSEQSGSRDQANVVTPTAAVSADNASRNTNALSGTSSSCELNLSTLEKIKRFFFSKEEWEEYLLERLEEERRRKGKPGEPLFESDANSPLMSL